MLTVLHAQSASSANVIVDVRMTQLIGFQCSIAVLAVIALLMACLSNYEPREQV